MRYILSLVLASAASTTVAQTWCGKHYKQHQPIVPPGGQFPVPATSSSPLLAFRCAQTIRPYISGDGNDTNQPVSILVDAPIVYSYINNTQPISISNSSDPGSLSVTVTTTNGGTVLAQGSVPVNSNKTELPFSLSALQPRSSAYNVTCTAKYNTQTFVTTTLLTYLPSLPSGIGSVTKMDSRTGALLARPANGTGSFAPVLPIGFYTQFDSYLATDLSIPATLASQGFNMIHLIPPFSNPTLFDQVLDNMQQAGLYAMYDMRFSYMDLASVTEQVNGFKARPNLLLWYTGDEPDGTSDPLGATTTTSNLITSLDGGDGQGGAGYHPVSLVLNCENYYFTQYSSGADIVMQDTYTIGNNMTWSDIWNTPCTTDFGDCACDNCKGSFEDISTRMDEFNERIFINGWERKKALWTVPQGFGNESYWTRYPTGQEFVVSSVIGINHGGLGVVSWSDPTTSDIKAYASTLALSLKQMNSFILSPLANVRQITVNRVDCGLWTVGSKTLVLATNMNYASQTIPLTALNLSSVTNITQVMNTGSGITPANDGFTFTSVGSGGFIVSFNVSSGKQGGGQGGGQGGTSESSGQQTNIHQHLDAPTTSMLLLVTFFTYLSWIIPS